MKLKLIIITLIIFMYSCKDSKKETIIIPEIKKETPKEEHNHNENESIVFNNGEKWKVVDHMMAHIKRMNLDVANFKGTTLKEHQDLSAKLIENINLLTANCTMTGQAHDELHKWLLPFIDIANNFTEVKTIEEAKTQYNKIKKSFKDLNTYFK